MGRPGVQGALLFIYQQRPAHYGKNQQYGGAFVA
jgi:hypothetical protein